MALTSVPSPTSACTRLLHRLLPTRQHRALCDLRRNAEWVAEARNTSTVLQSWLDSYSDQDFRR
jgi:hypothetical protein